MTRGVAVLLALVEGCGAARAYEPARVVEREDQAIARVLEARGSGCSAEALAQVPARAWPLGPSGPWLVHAVCELGAYQPTGGLFVVRGGGEVERVPLPLVGEDGALTSSLDVGEIEVEPSRHTLTELTRFRGLGDCGRRVRVRLGPDGVLTLLEHREQPCSDDEAAEHVTDRDRWPLRFPPVGTVAPTE